MKRILPFILCISLLASWHSPASAAPTNKRIGICLSGGGALGFAHIGVIQALREYGIHPDEVAGTSMGAIIGTMYAAGYSPVQMLDIIRENNLYSTTKLMTWIPELRKTGISNHDELRKILTTYIPHNTFDALKYPMHVCVANLNSGKYEIISSGNNLDMWVAASASIPWVFENIVYNGTHYTDGGALNNFPAQVLQETCDVIIGVNVTPYIPNDTEITLATDVLIHTIRAALNNNSEEGITLCDHLIVSEAIREYNEFDFSNYLEIYQYGYDAAQQYIKENNEILQLRKEY